ncbi:MAG: GTPase RsgA, partial [bacterium]
TSTNPIAVGDFVEFEWESEEGGSAIITELHARRNYVNRISPANKRMHHIIASNIDQSVLIATIKDPKTSTGFIDRFLVTCEAFHIPAIVLFNKADIYRDKELKIFQERKEIY